MSKVCRFQEKTVTLQLVMNWKFILRWVLTFIVVLIVYNLTKSFWMSLGILILLAAAEGYAIDFWEKRRKNK